MKRPEKALKIPTKVPKRSLRSADASVLVSTEPQSLIPIQGASTSVKTFVENVFIPRFVKREGGAGLIHYYSILKYILTPETVEMLFSVYGVQRKTRLTTKANWPYLDEVRLCDLSAERVRQLISSALAAGYSPQTAKHIRTVIGAIIKLAIRENFFSTDNPISGVRLPTLTRREYHDLTVDQAKTILGRLNYPTREVALLTICTGLSVPEICALRWKDINFSHATVNEGHRRIPARSMMVGNLTRLRGSTPIQRNPEKYVRMSDMLAALLLDLRQRQVPQDAGDLLLSSPDGDSQSPLTIRSLQLREVSKELQMPWLSWQVLKRGHQVLLQELRIALSDELVSSTFHLLSATRVLKTSPGFGPQEQFTGMALARPPF